MWFELQSFQNTAVLLALALAVAWAALALHARLTSRAGKASAQVTPNEVAFLFDGAELVDCTPAARRLIDITDGADSDLVKLARFLAPRFPNLLDRIACPGAEGPEALTSTDGMSRLQIKCAAGRLHLTLADATDSVRFYTPDRHSVAALFEELKMHRAMANNLTFPLWRQTPDGQITWTNEEYRRLSALLGAADAPGMPPTQLFSDPPQTNGDARQVQRVKLALPHEAEPRWFEYQVNWVADDILVAAVPMDRVVRAEHSLHGFVQTLTQTFAHLNVGLAIFNRSRELVIFNPALNELMDLSPEFLVARPTLTQVFDRLRETRMVPEQKDYRSWRDTLSELEAAAADNHYTDTWSLIDGRTLRVTGRPHPEGAVAFLFQDISGEIALERDFRTELLMQSAVIDGVDEAIAVFDTAGVLALSNAAYDHLWFEPDPSSPGLNIVDATRHWQAKCLPTPVWGDARDFAAAISDRANWSADIRLQDGRMLACRFDALPGGHTLVGFRPKSDAKDNKAMRRKEPAITGRMSA
ncbi:sensor [Candidatus Rhodobacter oscarellae]|uniref:Sensor n=1 Tax=Candidatus Rhodobacter oscarellae TaxID=1675527 RepID=A0A0J9EG36_9RHOB|nr:PAS-domain containing protein [Candidatus Rhodobacter lobularis]KMW60624.1 sensor [Candidatus Rhodobacter lobularis]